MTPQQKRVLAASRAYNGTCAADFAAPNVCDRGKPIMRVPARIGELEKLYGYSFEIVGWRGSTKCYRLTEVPGVERGGGVEGPPCLTRASRVPSRQTTPSLSSGVERGTGHAHVAQDHVGVSSAGVALSPGRLFEVGVSQYGFADQERAA